MRVFTLSCPFWGSQSARSGAKERSMWLLRSADDVASALIVRFRTRTGQRAGRRVLDGGPHRRLLAQPAAQGAPGHDDGRDLAAGQAGPSRVARRSTRRWRAVPLRIASAGGARRFYLDVLDKLSGDFRGHGACSVISGVVGLAQEVEHLGGRSWIVRIQGLVVAGSAHPILALAVHVSKHLRLFKRHDVGVDHREISVGRVVES